MSHTVHPDVAKNMISSGGSAEAKPAIKVGVAAE